MFLAFLIAAQLPAAPSLDRIDLNEVQVVEQLIETTNRQLVMQRGLKAQMVAFRKHKDAFFEGDQSKERAKQMVTVAHSILMQLKDHHLDHLFSDDYMEELNLFSSIATKKSARGHQVR